MMSSLSQSRGLLSPSTPSTSTSTSSPSPTISAHRYKYRCLSCQARLQINKTPNSSNALDNHFVSSSQSFSSSSSSLSSSTHMIRRTSTISSNATDNDDTLLPSARRRGGLVSCQAMNSDTLLIVGAAVAGIAAGIGIPLFYATQVKYIMNTVLHTDYIDTFHYSSLLILLFLFILILSYQADKSSTRENTQPCFACEGTGVTE